MKTFILILFAIFVTAQFSYAQWTTGGSNIFNSNTGNVGIGTTNPIVKLQVAGDISTQRISDDSGTALSAGAGTHDLGIYNTRNGFWTRIVTNAGPIKFFIDGSSANGYIGGTPSVIFNSDGHVGVGTNSPISTFQVGDSFYKTSIGSASNVNLNYGTGYLGFNAARNSGSWTVNGDNYHNGGGIIYNDVFGNIYFVPIPSNGPGTQTLTDLDVKSLIRLKIGYDGIVYAKQINVQTSGWPDYVFNTNYNLPSLNTIKTYIDQNHHLPGIPTESEVYKSGLNLGEMDKTLVKKVEELTLYLIEKDKQIENQEDQIKALKLCTKSQDEKINNLEGKLQLILKKSNQKAAKNHSKNLSLKPTPICN